MTHYLETALDNIAAESIKAAFNLCVALITLGLGWVVGQRLSIHWALYQKQREIDLSAAQDFHRLYGEFFAIWKLWNYYIRDIGATHLPGASRWDLLKRACDAESLVERVFVKLAAERDLRAADLDRLGRFRQGYQHLRQSIGDNKPLEWDRSTHPEYLAFKRLAVEVAILIQSGGIANSGKRAGRVESLLEITSNHHESTWSK
jgi:hypothetical protein